MHTKIDVFLPFFLAFLQHLTWQSRAIVCSQALPGGHKSECIKERALLARYWYSLATQAPGCCCREFGILVSFEEKAKGAQRGSCGVLGECFIPEDRKQ
jgi:hypothetical protein